MDTLHKGNDDDDDDDDNVNNNNNNNINNYNNNLFLSLLDIFYLATLGTKSYFCTRLRSVTHTNSTCLPWTRDQAVGKGLYLHKKQNSQKTDILDPGWIRTRNQGK